MSRKISLWSLLMLSMICWVSCKKKEPDANACTQSFAIIAVRVVDGAGRPLVLDSTVSIGATGAVMPSTDRRDPFTTAYTVVDDTYLPQLAGHTESVRFWGFKGGSRVIDTPFVVTADRCHISKVSGPDTLRSW